jgi:MFS family permease
VRSARIGRKNTYYTFFVIGIICYLLMPSSANAGSKVVFVSAVCIILSMYGGGFATVPAYLADMFGTQFVGTIHGRLLTAWSTAGIIGPVVVNYIREAQLAAGVPRDHLYDYTLYILAGMLVIGLICNFLVKPVDPKWYMSPDEVARLQAASAKSDAAIPHGSFGIGKGGLDWKAAAFWAFVGVPLAWACGSRWSPPRKSSNNISARTDGAAARPRRFAQRKLKRRLQPSKEGA